MIFTILGFLLIKSLTMYEIRKILEGKVSPFYSGSYGSIGSAIKKLLNEGLISYEEEIKNGRNKKIYSISLQGKKHFMAWLESDIPFSTQRDNVLNRMFFFGFLESIKQIDLLKKHIELLEESLKEYDEFQSEALKKRYTGTKKSIAKFQLKTLEYGIEQIKFDIKWYKKQIREIKENT
ncbi:MAG: PadR family transcriptional regulator [Clostridiales bacterium]|nr:PadR family transcriptional regulator [Clostridiales bacterium]